MNIYYIYYIIFNFLVGMVNNDGGILYSGLNGIFASLLDVNQKIVPFHT